MKWRHLSAQIDFVCLDVKHPFRSL